MNRLAMGATVEPIASNRWSMSGPYGCVEMTLADSGGWDIGGEIVKKREHFGSLHQAMMRAYNIAMGHVRM